MAFEDYSVTRKNTFIKDNQLTLTATYINLANIPIPWNTVRLQVDAETVRLRIVEGEEGVDYSINIDRKTGNRKVYCYSLLHRGILPMGIYQLTPDQDPDSFTFQFIRPRTSWHKKGGL